MELGGDQRYGATKNNDDTGEYVCSRNIYSAFTPPTILLYELEETVVVTWMQDAQHLKCWNRQFHLTTNNESRLCNQKKSREMSLQVRL